MGFVKVNLILVVQIYMMWYKFGWSNTEDCGFNSRQNLNDEIRIKYWAKDEFHVIYKESRMGLRHAFKDKPERKCHD